MVDHLRNMVDRLIFLNKHHDYSFDDQTEMLMNDLYNYYLFDLMNNFYYYDDGEILTKFVTNDTDDYHCYNN